MSFVRIITDLFESIFMSSSPEVKKRQALRALDSKMRDMRPAIYKNGMLLANFAEAFHILYQSLIPIFEILSSTISGDDVQRNWKYEEQLILTGFSKENQEIMQSLLFENRKQEIINSTHTEAQVYEMQRQRFKKLVKEFNTPEFAMIQTIIDKLHQLCDICKFNCISVIRIFDTSFIPDPGYKPVYQQVPVEKLERILLDLYYLISDFEITASMGDAVVALATLHKHNKSISENEKQNIIMNLEKISAVFKQILTPDIIKSLICISKKDPDFTPKVASYKSSALQKYATHLQEQFTADEGRIKTELKDELISNELQELFGSQGVELMTVQTYNSETNEVLQQNGAASFAWVLPIQIVKTFIYAYYSPKIKGLLNDIAIEGIFSNPTYKTEFSSLVYACNDAVTTIEKFEELFKKGNAFDESVMLGYIKDSHKDAEFIKMLAQYINRANMAAKELIQNLTNLIYSLYNHIAELLLDMKKSAPEDITNLKVLMFSSRNRDNTALLEKQHALWHLFLEIMKNYAVVGELDKKHS